MAIVVYRHDGSRDVTQNPPDKNDWNNMLDLVSSITEGHTHDGADSMRLAAGSLPDHAPRHENGGDDEISIAGLAGESAEMANYLRNNANDETTGRLIISNTSTFAFRVRDSGATVTPLQVDTTNGVVITEDLRSAGNNAYDFGTSAARWKDGYFAGSLSDGTNALTIANAKSAYDHSQIAGGDSVHVSTTENTNWDAAYTHSQDNNQAHSDYLKNDANDAGKSLVLTDASSIPLVLNNSTGTQNILTLKDNGTDRLVFKDRGMLAITPEGSSTDVSAARLDYDITHSGSHQGFTCVTDLKIATTNRTCQSGNYLMRNQQTGQSNLALRGFGILTRQEVAETLSTAIGIRTMTAISNGVAGTISDAWGVNINMSAEDGTMVDARGLYVTNFQKDAGSITTGASIWLDKQTVAGTNYGIVLDGDGVGADLVLGAGQPDKIYHDGTDLVLDAANGIKLGNDTTNYTHVSSTGDVVFVGSSGLAFGEIYTYDSGTTITISTAGIANKVQITSFDTNGASNNATADHTNDHITITKAGKYLATVSLSAETAGAGGSDEFGFGLFRNNGTAEFQNVHSHRELSGGGGDTGSVSMSGIVDLAVDDTIEVWCWNEDSTDNLVVDDITLTLIQVGG